MASSSELDEEAARVRLHVVEAEHMNIVLNRLILPGGLVDARWRDQAEDLQKEATLCAADWAYRSDQSDRTQASRHLAE